MLMTDMWQPNEQSRILYAPGTSTQAEEEDPASWESRFARVLRSEGCSYRNFAGASPRFGGAMATDGWQEYLNRCHHDRSCSTPPHARMNTSFGESPLPVKYHPYHDASVVDRHDHQTTANFRVTPVESGHSPPSNSVDSAEELHRKDSSLAHDNAVAFNEVEAARKRISNRQPEMSRKNDSSYLGGEIRQENFARQSHDKELPRFDANDPINCREAGLVSDQLKSRSHSRNNLEDLGQSGPSSQDLRSDFRIDKRTLSSSKTHLASHYPESNGPYSRFEGHRVQSYPRRYSSVLDDTPVIVHQYGEQTSQAYRGHPKRNSISVNFPSTATTATTAATTGVGGDGGDGSSSMHDNKDSRYSIKDSADHRQRYHHQGSPRLDIDGEVRPRRASDISGIPRFPLHRHSEKNKESPQVVGSSLTGAGSPCTDRRSFLMSSSPSLPPLTPASPRLEPPTSSIPKPLSHPPNESSDSSFASAGETSRPTTPSKPRTALARSHVPKKHSSKDLCVICGDKASGYHYNTLSCEGCKGFFRRTITRNLHYHCKYGGNCVMDMWMRRKCPACRLKRCKQVGMREECLLTEHQCVIRNTRRRMKMKMKKKEDESDVQTKGEGTEISPDDTQAILASLNSEHRDLIERLVNLQDKYELPSDEDLKLLREDKMYNAPSQEDLSDAIFVHMVEMTILVTRLIVEFAKNLPGFHNLAKEDQILLLKSSSSEVMMLRTARRYNSETNTIVFGNGIPFSPSSMAFGGLQESVESLFNFSRSMSSLYVDNAEYALLTAMCIFSVRSGLMNPSVVDKLQEVYMDVLIAYVGKRRSKCQNYLAKLLMKFVHLRTLGHEHSQTLYNLTLKKGSLPPLLTEYFDISE